MLIPCNPLVLYGMFVLSYHEYLLLNACGHTLEMCQYTINSGKSINMIPLWRIDCERSVYEVGGVGVGPSRV